MADIQRTTSLGAKAKITLEVASSVVMLCAAGAILWTVFRGPAPGAGAPAAPTVPVPREPLPVVGARILGDPTAKVGIVLFSDFECPFRARFARETLPELKKLYIDTGKAFLAFRHLPLPIHANARQAAEAAECASTQGRFWEMHDLFFGPEFSFKNPDWLAATRGLAPNVAVFDQCLQVGAGRDEIVRDMSLAEALQIRGTPTSFIGLRNGDGSVSVKQALGGAQPVARFREALQNALGIGN